MFALDQPSLLSQLTKSIRAHLVEHDATVGPVGGAPRKPTIQNLRAVARPKTRAADECGEPSVIQVSKAKMKGQFPIRSLTFIQKAQHLTAERLDRMTNSLLAELARLHESLRAAEHEVLEFSVAPPLNSSEMSDAHSILPQDVLNFFTTECGSFVLRWRTRDGITLPAPMSEILGSDCAISLPDPSPIEWCEERTLVPLIESDTHNTIAVDVNSGEIVNVDGYEEDQHLWILGASLSDFLARWVKIGLVGPENWQWASLCDPIRGLQPDSDQAGVLRTALGIH